MTAGDLLGLANREPWQDQALCAQVDPEIFFPPKGGSPREAKKVCAACPVAAECLAYALRNHELHGVWGGTCEKERRRLMPNRPRADYTKHVFNHRRHGTRSCYAGGCRCEFCKSVESEFQRVRHERRRSGGAKTA